MLSDLIDEIKRILFPTKSTCTICDVEIKIKPKEPEENNGPGENKSPEKK